MKKIKGLTKVLILLIPIMAIISTNLTYAVQDNSGPWLRLYNGGANPNRKSGHYTFSTTEANENGGYQPVFKIVKTNSSGTSQTDYNTGNADEELIYCLKNGLGFGQNGAPAFNHYTQKFDMYNYNNIDETYRAVLPSGTDYNKLLWILDHVCVPGNDSQRNALITAAGASIDAFNRNDLSADMRNDIIDAVQQVAIWKYTGNPYPNEFNMKINGEFLSTYGETDILDDDNLATNTAKIYNYLINNNGNTGATQKILEYVKGFKNSATQPTIEESGDNYIVGPFQINGDASKLNEFTVTITDGTNAIANAKLVGSNKTTELSGNTLADKVKSSFGSEFYILVPSSASVSNVKLNIVATYNTKTITYWSVPASEMAKNQPVVIIKPTEVRDPGEAEVPIERPEFDLALRKWISTIAKADGTVKSQNVRTINVDESTISSQKTATYKHAKNPVEVENGDIVTYNLSIFNEGEIEGRPTQITDKLPAGLEFVEIDNNSANSNLYALESYDKDNGNTLVLKRNATTNIPAYTAGTLATNSETVTIKCKVNANEADANKTFTNVAWISKEVNGRTGKEIINEVGEDRDSQPGTYPPITDLESYKGTTDKPLTELGDANEYYPGYQDDDDFEKIKLVVPNQPKFDLALRKFFTQIGTTAVKDREPQITQESLRALAEGTAGAFDTTTAHKTHGKDPKNVTNGTNVIYTIRIYNEGDIDGYATEITDYLPAGLKFTENSTINKNYGWQPADDTGRVYKTSFLANTKLNKFDKTPANGTYIMSKEGGQIADIQIECTVDTSAGLSGNILRNIAEITSERPDGEQTISDIDSTPGNVHHDDSYNPAAPTEGKGEQDDDDFEDLKLVRFDLALRKFITGVNNLGKEEEISNRAPEVDTSKFGTIGEDGKEITTCEYKHTKDPVRVEQNNIVTYTIRIYNEGNTDGYASIVKDDVPEGLEFLPEHSTNKEYRWNILEDGSIATDYLSKEQNPNKIINAFDKTTMKEPDSQDLKVAFRVTEPNTSDRIIINSAQVSKHTDEDGNEVPDIDSTPDEWIDGEDDQDREYLYVKYFNLALRKWVTHAIVIEDGVQKEMATGHTAEDDPEAVVKVELNKKRLEETVVKFRYSIRISNIGEIAGYAKEISDYIPDGLKFNQSDNPQWREENGKIVTDQLKDTLLQPGDIATVEVLLTWINDENKMGVMTNVAEISEDYNDSHTPDINSTPNNRKEGEDDIDDAPVALTVVAGSAPTYLAITTGITLIIGVGIFLIKKFVI